MARPKRFELPFSGIGIRCVIQLRHGRIYCSGNRRIINYTHSHGLIKSCGENSQNVHDIPLIRHRIKLRICITQSAQYSASAKQIKRST